MPKVLTARGSDGLVAIHEPGADLNNPMSNVENIYFHSALDYLTVVRTVNTTVTVPAITIGKGFITLFQHGMGRPCLLMARRTDTNEAICGTSLAWTGGHVQYWASIAICADDVNVYAYYMAMQNASVTIPVEIAVLGNPLF